MIRLSPGALLNLGETLSIDPAVPNTTGAITIRRFTGGPVLLSQETTAQPLVWTPTEPGAYIVEFRSAHEVLTRYVGVVAPGWAVCQLTIGALTSDDFDAVVHPPQSTPQPQSSPQSSPVPVDYYITLHQAEDERWRNYEHRYGDAIHPHLHTNDFGAIAPELAHHDPNWDSLSLEKMIACLRALQTWWQNKGYDPLDRIASYTPCNKLIQACRATGIRVVHSLCPEQNWSDGEWAINHWGMPTCPFWVADDDFRKPGARRADGVLAITMNHYQVLLPHLTHWGDFVLSPSHTLRWHRSCDVGETPVRFEQFARDTISNVNPQSALPLFFVAGFEFGKALGVSKMTDHNRRGLEILIELSRTVPLVFATSRDVRAYYDRHVPVLPDRILLQRDTWAGARTMGKPGVAPDSVVIERGRYKALICDGEPLAMFHYDYTQTWNYPTAATDVPEDFATADQQALTVQRSPDKLTFSATQPLPRPIPVMLWDAHAAASLPTSLRAQDLPVLDDQRHHQLLEVPAGWQGRQEIPLHSTPPSRLPRPDWWQTRTFGTGSRRHTYLHLDLPLLHDVQIPIQLKRPVSVDGPHGPLGPMPAGPIILTVGPHRTWHRFWNAETADLEPDPTTLAAIANLRPATDLLADNWQLEQEKHVSQLHQALLQQHGLREEQIALQVICGAKLPLGSRSRSTAYDLVRSKVPGLIAHEYSDGAIAYGPGKSFWEHARSFSFKIHGLNSPSLRGPLQLVLHSFDPLALNARFKVGIAGHAQDTWILPPDPLEPAAWYRLTIDPAWIDASGTLRCHLKADHPHVLHDWWQERGFLATLHALWVVTT